MNRARHYHWLVVAIALASACAKDKSTALDVKLTVMGDIDQVSIDAIQVGTKDLDLTGEKTKFSATGRMLRDGDVFTIWFADSADMQQVIVTATGLLCGKSATPSAMTPMKMLAKGQTVETALMLANDGSTVCDNDGGSGGAGGTTGAGGAGGTVGQGGTTGTAGTGGAGGTTGTAGTGGTTGTAGTGGAVGRGGTTGTAGTGGAAGRGGTTGTAGTGGAAGRGGTTGTAGTGGGAAGRGGATGTAGTGGGAAGRGGTTGTAGRGGTTGAAGRGGTTGSGGAGASCGTLPADASAQLGAFMPGMQATTCGHPISGTTAQYITTGADLWALANGPALNNGTIYAGNCGRCVRLVRTLSDNTTRTADVTLVGGCSQVCQNMPTPRFEVSNSAYQLLAASGQTSIPAGGNETLTYSFIPCPTPANATILANFKPAGGTGAVPSVLFVQHRYGILSATVEDPAMAGSPQISMSRGNDGYWFRNDSMPLPTGTAVPAFRLTDVNNSLLTLTNLPPGNTPMFSSTGQQFPLLCTP